MYKRQNWSTLQRGLSAIAELLVLNSTTAIHSEGPSSLTLHGSQDFRLRAKLRVMHHTNNSYYYFEPSFLKSVQLSITLVVRFVRFSEVANNVNECIIYLVASAYTWPCPSVQKWTKFLT